MAALTVAAGASLLFTARNGLDCDLFSLAIPLRDGDALKTAVSAMSRSARMFVKADSYDAARARLAGLGVFDAAAGGNGCAGGKGGGVVSALRALEPYATGFLSPGVRRQLENGEFAAVRDAAAARLFSPVHPVLPVRADPFLLFTDYAMDMSDPKGGWVPVEMELDPDEAGRILRAVAGADDVRCAGAPFHTAVAAGRTKREIGVLSAVSLFCVMLFGWLLTRSLRFLPLLAALLASSFCIASAALFAAFPKPHAVAFVFGTVLIGLGSDYAYHALVARGSVARPLTLAFLSTAACFMPLVFSRAEAIRQMAVFTVAGLSAAYACALSYGGGGAGTGAGGAGAHASPFCRRDAARRVAWLLALQLALMAVAVVGVVHGVFPRSSGTDVARLYRPDPYLAEGERIAIESAGGVPFIPSADEQRRNDRLVRSLYKAEGENYCRITGLPVSVLEPRGAYVPFDPKGVIGGLFDGWRKEIDGMFLVSMAVLAVVLAVLFGWGCLDFLLPVLSACCITFAVLMCMGEALDFFARICFFIFTGLGLDYGVFRRYAGDGDGEGCRLKALAVRYSFLTSLAGFGALSFTGLAATRLMGITLAVGLAASYLAAKMCGGFSRIFASRCGDRPPAAWHEQREQCASIFWARFMWCTYRWFGKTFQKVVFVIGMPVIYMFSGQARMALRSFYGVLSGYTGQRRTPSFHRLFRHILGFAWGLMDKTDACTLMKNPPAMSVREDEGWKAFRRVIGSGGGAMILCSHVGTVGVLPALPSALRACGLLDSGADPKVHAFQQMGHDAVFMKVFMAHFDFSRFELHAVEDIGVETAVNMVDAIRRGELVVMAGDRVSAGSGSVLRHGFLGRECVWPKGAFRFAELMEAPVFAVTCVSTGWNRYEVHFAALDRSALLDGYVAFLERETLEHPEQWYQFYDFFRQ